MLRILFFTFSFLLASLPAQSAEKLTVLLDWFVNPDHAPLVVAKQRGMFDAAGLEVDLIPPADPSAPPRLVAAGQADLAISYQPQLHVQVSEGLPLVRIATIVETPLNSLIVLKDGPVKTIADLKGKKIGFSVGGFEDALLKAMLGKYGVSIDEVELVNVNFALSPSLFNGNVDAVIGAYRNFELNQMDIEGKPGTAYYPEEHGVPVFDELILVVKKGTAGDPRFKTFVNVLEEATLFLTNHPDEAWQDFIAAHPDLDNELNRRAWRDTLPRFAKRPLALDAGRYLRFAEFMKASGLIGSTPALETYAVELK